MHCASSRGGCTHGGQALGVIPVELLMGVLAGVAVPSHALEAVVAQGAQEGAVAPVLVPLGQHVGFKALYAGNDEPIPRGVPLDVRMELALSQDLIQNVL